MIIIWPDDVKEVGGLNSSELMQVSFLVSESIYELYGFIVENLCLLVIDIVSDGSVEVGLHFPL